MGSGGVGVGVEAKGLGTDLLDLEELVLAEEAARVAAGRARLSSARAVERRGAWRRVAAGKPPHLCAEAGRGADVRDREGSLVEHLSRVQVGERHLRGRLPEGSGNGRLVEDLDVASGTSAVGMRYASRLVDAAAGRVVDVSWPAGGERRGGSPPVERRGEAEQVLLELWQLAGALQRLGAHQQRDGRLDIPVLAWGRGGAGGGVQGSRTGVAGGQASV